MSDLDKNMRGGRIRRLGAPEELDDAVRLCDLKAVQQVSAPGFLSGGGGRGERGLQGPAGTGGGGVGTQGNQGNQGNQGAVGAGTQGPQGNQGDVGSQGFQGNTGAGTQGPQGNQGDVGSQGFQGFQGEGSQGFQGAGALYQFEMGQELDSFTLPFVNAASELVSTAATLTTFRGSRAVPGTAGTTTIQLELNGVAVGGAILSWTPVDLAFSIKTVAIALAVVPGDRLSIRLTSAETGSEDVFGEAD